VAREARAAARVSGDGDGEAADDGGGGGGAKKPLPRELRNLVLPDREWNVPGGGGGGDDGGGGSGGGGGGGDGGGAQGAKSAAVHASQAESKPSSASGARNLLCSKGCGRSFGWPPARASHEKLCKGAPGGAGGGGGGGSAGGAGSAERDRAAAPTEEERLSAGGAGAASKDGRGTPLVEEDDMPIDILN